ncbi:MAG: dihydroorotate dehydrogenase electron transfer subunit [bacterium]|jgi:dihydroorotate dehydrogenase electron transfer subunit|nr:dihydroorotate dehydrogenase electron transfer subunit [Planctomycetota bacterium]HIL52699.1 dihydroorotate dehydrogenase electron transfer subunit [Planctomycetota bacterium]
MPRPPEDSRSQTAEVISVESLGADGVLLRVRPQEPLPRLRGARFFMLRREDRLSPAIPRPFSLYDQAGDELVFLIKLLGRGTRALGDMQPGARLRLIGPLGNGWPTFTPAQPLVMLAGGIGSVPFLVGIADALREGVAAEDMTMIYGAATAAQLFEFERFAALGVRVLAATDDGSRGFAGHALECLAVEQEEGRIPPDAWLYACGPGPMLAAVERLSRNTGVPAWLSLEELMGCGVGICNGCPVPTRPEGPLGAWNNAKCCVEGPVFSTDAIQIAEN